MAEEAKQTAAASVVDGRRTALYSDLDSFKASSASTEAAEGRRISLYSDLDSFKASSASISDGSQKEAPSRFMN